MKVIRVEKQKSRDHDPKNANRQPPSGRYFLLHDDRTREMISQPLP